MCVESGESLLGPGRNSSEQKAGVSGRHKAYTREKGSRVVCWKVLPFTTEKADGGIIMIWETGSKEKLRGDETTIKGTLFRKTKIIQKALRNSIAHKITDFTLELTTE